MENGEHDEKDTAIRDVLSISALVLVTWGLVCRYVFDWRLLPMGYKELETAFETLSWPFVVLILGLVFKTSIRALLTRVTKFESKLFNAELIADISEVEDLTVTDEASDLPSRTVNEKAQEAVEITSDPRLAIIRGWIEIEDALNSFTSALGLPGGSISVVVGRLQSIQKLSPLDAASIKHLQQIRNKAVHQKEFDLEPAAAESFVKVSRGIASHLRHAASKEANERRKIENEPTPD